MKGAAILPMIPITLLAISLSLGVAAASGAQAADGAVGFNPGALLQLEGKPPTEAPPSAAPTGHTAAMSHSEAKPHRGHEAGEHEVARRPHVLPPPPPIEPHPSVPEQAIGKTAARAAPAKPVKPPHAAAVPPLMVAFGGTTDRLQPDAARRIEEFAEAHRDVPGRFLIAATAPGQPGESAAARRLSLARGQAVGAILRDAGIASERIIVQALGDPPGAATDHVTLSIIP